jgi:hypothetical protein
VLVVDKGRIKFGAVLGKGAFGTVKLAHVAFDDHRTGHSLPVRQSPPPASTWAPPGGVVVRCVAALHAGPRRVGQSSNMRERVSRVRGQDHRGKGRRIQREA